MIKGIQKTSLIDFPKRIACTIFLGGCNFACGYCYNSDLVQRPATLPSIKEDAFFEFLEKRKKYLEGVCITGGEPTLHPGLIELCRKIKELGYLIKLDTNGTNPKVVKELIDKRLVDYIAMDIKASPNNYRAVINSKTNMDNIKESVKLIMGTYEYEFRTTVLTNVHTKEEFKLIGEWLRGAKAYYLQQFRAMETAIDKKYSSAKSYSIEELEEFKVILKEYIDKVELRGC